MNKKKITFIVPAGDRNWILEGICKEIEKYTSHDCVFHPSTKNLPESDIYYLSHYSFVPYVLERNPHISGDKIIAWYTHPRDIGFDDKELIDSLNLIKGVFFSCSVFRDLMISKGLSEEKSCFFPAGADDSLFYPINTEQKSSDEKVIGFCLGYRSHEHYRDRKNYPLVIELIKEIVKKHRVLLVGRDWAEYEHFEELKTLKNFTYKEVPYSEYPDLYRKMDIFISASKLEGGPIPVVEALMSGVFTLASDTGLSRDVIEEGTNGFRFPVDADAQTILQLVDQACSLLNPEKVHNSVKQFNWQNFTKEIEEYIEK